MDGVDEGLEKEEDALNFLFDPSCENLSSVSIRTINRFLKNLDWDKSRKFEGKLKISEMTVKVCGERKRETKERFLLRLMCTIFGESLPQSDIEISIKLFDADAREARLKELEESSEDKKLPALTNSTVKCSVYETEMSVLGTRKPSCCRITLSAPRNSARKRRRTAENKNVAAGCSSRVGNKKNFLYRTPIKKSRATGPHKNK